MDTVRDIAITFCASAVFTAAISLLHGRALEKSGRYIIALVLLCSVISAVAKGDFDFSLPTAASAAQEYKGVSDLCEYQAEYIISNILKDNGIMYKNITAKATKNEDGSIIINEIQIEGVKEENSVRQVLTEQGIDCRVVIR